MGPKMAAAVAFSSFVALSLSPMLASKVLPPGQRKTGLAYHVDRVFDGIRNGYSWLLQRALRARWLVVLLFFGILAGTTWLMRLLDAHPEIVCKGELCFGPFLLPGFQQALAAYNQRKRLKRIPPWSRTPRPSKAPSGQAGAPCCPS